jgi:hypothetical protein
VINRPFLAPALAVLALLALAGCDADETSAGSGLEVLPPSVVLGPGGQQSFVADAGAAAVEGVVWSVREGGAGGTVTSSGLYTAPASPGTFTVVATEPSSGRSGQAAIVVRSGGAGPTFGMTIPTAHPRLWFDAARLSRARTWLAAHPFSPNSSEDYWGGYAENAMLGLLNNNSTGACTAAINWAMGDGLSQMTVTGGVACDSCRWTGEQVILVYDWCYDYFTPTQRATFTSRMNASITHWSQEPWGGAPMYGNNYYWGYLRNELEWAITSYHENQAVAEGLLAHVFTSRLANNFDPSTLEGGDSRGGVPHEQFGYGATTGEYASLPFRSVALLGRDLFRETDFWRELAYAYIYATTPAPTIVPGASTYEGQSYGYTLFPANDDEGFHERYYMPRSHYFPNYMMTVVDHFGATNVGRHARQYLNSYGAGGANANLPWKYYKAVDDGTATPLPFTGLPLDYFASGAGNLFTRNAWGSGAGVTNVWIQGGDFDTNTLGHQHADYGTFHIWRSAAEGANVRGRYLSRETVTYTETVTGYGGAGTAEGAGSIAHNSLLINGASVGPQYTGGDAVVERAESQPGYSYLAMKLTPPATAAQVWRREFVFVRGLETLVVLDRLQTASAGATKTFLNHCETNPVVSGDSATCTVGGSALVMTTLLPGSAQTAYRVVDEGSAVMHQYRIEVDTTPGTAQSYILTVLQAKDAGAASLAPTATEDASSMTLRLDASTTITFAKGMTSAGGSVTIGGSTTPLRASVQRMTVSDAGPAWAP